MPFVIYTSLHVTFDNVSVHCLFSVYRYSRLIYVLHLGRGFLWISFIPKLWWLSIFSYNHRDIPIVCTTTQISSAKYCSLAELKLRILLRTWNTGIEFCSAPGIQIQIIVPPLESKHRILVHTWNTSIEYVPQLESKHRMLFRAWNPSTEYCSRLEIQAQNIVIHLKSNHKILLRTWNPSTEYCSMPEIQAKNLFHAWNTSIEFCSTPEIQA